MNSECYFLLDYFAFAFIIHIIFVNIVHRLSSFIVTFHHSVHRSLR